MLNTRHKERASNSLKIVLGSSQRMDQTKFQSPTWDLANVEMHLQRFDQTRPVFLACEWCQMGTQPMGSSIINLTWDTAPCSLSYAPGLTGNNLQNVIACWKNYDNFANRSITCESLGFSIPLHSLCNYHTFSFRMAQEGNFLPEADLNIGYQIGLIIWQNNLY